MAREYTPKKQPLVERWRLYAQRYLPNAPTEFILAWIQHESDGKMNTRTSLDERGILQIHPSEAKGMRLPTADFNFLLTGTDMDRHFRIGAAFVRYKQRQADQQLARNATYFSGHDYWTYVKLGHGLPIIQSKGLADFRAANGRSPTSFAEFATWLRQTGWSYKSWSASRISQIVANAEAIGNWAGGKLSPTAVAVAAALTYGWFFL